MTPVGRRSRRFDPSVLGLPAAVAVIVVAQMLDGGSARSLWQPTAAMVVFGGTAAAVIVSFPFEVVWRAMLTIVDSFGPRRPAHEIEPTVRQLVNFSIESRRKGIAALEPEIDRAPDGFLRTALTMAVDGTHPKTARQILDIDNRSRRVADEEAADLLETAAGYTPTLGILGAVLGLIHVMQSLSEPTKLGSGIAVAFVATVYGVGAANLVLLPVATRLRQRAREAAVHRDLIIEGILALQEGLNPRIVERKLRSFVIDAQRSTRAA